MAYVYVINIGKDNIVKFQDALMAALSILLITRVNARRDMPDVHANMVEF